MYKDKDRQKQAVREATRRYRARGITKVSHEQGITPLVIASNVIPDDTIEQAIAKLEPCTPNDTCPICPHNRDCVEYKPAKPQSHNPMMVGYVPPGRAGSSDVSIVKALHKSNKTKTSRQGGMMADYGAR